MIKSDIINCNMTIRERLQIVEDYNELVYRYENGLTHYFSPFIFWCKN